MAWQTPPGARPNREIEKLSSISPGRLLKYAGNCIFR